MMEHNYKWITLIFHILIIFLSLLSFKTLLNFSGKNLLRFKTFSSFYMITFITCFITYGIIIGYLIVSKDDQDIIIYLFLCLVVWSIFNGLFLSVIKSFINNMEDRPSKKNSEINLLDNAMEDYILYSNK
ncbi:MAG: hypothetical protein MJ252_26165 [archaeon]|nr:hypothetical protein [archaeon]